MSRNTEAKIVIYRDGRRRIFVDGTEITGIKAIDFSIEVGKPDLIKVVFQPKSIGIEHSAELYEKFTEQSVIQRDGAGEIIA